MFWLSSDHTGGTPDPEAQVADGDLAVGKIVDEISHSPYWKDSAIFVVEDDSQDGADHVDGHRAPIQIISPYAQHGKVDSTYYSQITMVRTIEQILGAAAAEPEARRGHADVRRLHQQARPTRPSPRCRTRCRSPRASPRPRLRRGHPRADRRGRAEAHAQEARKAAVPAAQQGVAAQWQAWAAQQRFTGDSRRAGLRRTRSR